MRKVELRIILTAVGSAALVAVLLVVLQWDALLGEYYRYKLRTDAAFFKQVLMEPRGTPRREAASAFLETPEGRDAFWKRMGLYDIEFATPTDLSPSLRLKTLFFDPSEIPRGDFSAFLSALTKKGGVPQSEVGPENLSDLKGLFARFEASVEEIYRKQNRYVTGLAKVVDAVGRLDDSPTRQAPRRRTERVRFQMIRTLEGRTRFYYFSAGDYPEVELFKVIAENLRENLIREIHRLVDGQLATDRN